MILYYIIAFVIFLFSVYDVSIEGRRLVSGILVNRNIHFFVALILIVLGGIRWQTGTDWMPYYRYFINNSTWQEFYNGDFEILYSFLNFIVKYFSNSYTVFLCIFSFFVITLRVNTIRKIALYSQLSLFLFFCSEIGSIFAVRQTLAVSILSISIYYIQKKEKIAFLFIVIIATVIHKASIIWIFSYYLYHKNMKNRTIILLYIIAGVVGILGIRIYKPLVTSIFMPFESNIKLISKLIIYILDSNDPSRSLILMAISLVKRILFIPFLLLFRDKLIAENKYAGGLINLYITGNFIYLFFAFNDNFASLQRMTAPFLFIEIFILPIFLKIIKVHSYKYVFLSVVGAYGFLKLFSAINNFYELYVPYYSIFNHGFRTTF